MSVLEEHAQQREDHTAVLQLELSQQTQIQGQTMRRLTRLAAEVGARRAL
jgi:hypothetical protein